ncbi:hypothetical protein C8J57DRAFT_1540773 [Mycena rebaudengoi]|nr:hypothetical protein C8J57DRAFT_1540773 [Mycena rebaudengoi]
MQYSHPSSTFALIVGIDDYIATDIFPPLRGCVNDAEAFREFLLNDPSTHGLGVPARNIILLKNSEATRKAIMDTFKTHFTTNTSIREDEEVTMIFFFAGHGSRAHAPGNMMASDEQVETICPYDERTYTPSGEYVHGIPDYILGWLVYELSQKKGRNITLIFDSCHSGGMGRDSGTSRNAPSAPVPIPLALDRNLWLDNRGHYEAYNMLLQSRPSRILHSVQSHVLLAACRDNESAQERRVFLPDPPLHHTTYDDLLKRMDPLPSQHPHCGNTSSNRIVFTLRYPATGAGSMLLTKEDSGDISIALGSVHGVTIGTTFYVHRPDNTIFCILVATAVHIHKSILDFPKDALRGLIPAGSRAHVRTWSNHKMKLRVFLPPEFVHTSVIFPTPIDGKCSTYQNYVQVQSSTAAEIVLRCADVAEEVNIEYSNMAGWFLARVSAHRNPQLLVPIINAIAHFNYFLKCRPPDGSTHDFLSCTVEMRRLFGEYPGRRADPKLKNMVKRVEDRYEVRFLSEPDAMYGFVINNPSRMDLYPYLFYFDPVQCTIDPWYVPDGANCAPPLKRENTLNVGMGAEESFEFTLPRGMTTSSGFLKLEEFNPKERLTGLRSRQNLAHWEACCVQLTMSAP